MFGAFSGHMCVSRQMTFCSSHPLHLTPNTTSLKCTVRFPTLKVHNFCVLASPIYFFITMHMGARVERRPCQTWRSDSAHCQNTNRTHRLPKPKPRTSIANHSHEKTLQPKICRLSRQLPKYLGTSHSHAKRNTTMVFCAGV